MRRDQRLPEMGIPEAAFHVHRACRAAQTGGSFLTAGSGWPMGQRSLPLLIQTCRCCSGSRTITTDFDHFCSDSEIETAVFAIIYSAADIAVARNEVSLNMLQRPEYRIGTTERI